MATCVSCSPNPLVSLSSAATCPAFTSSPRCLPIISCSSKRKKKASAKSKTLPPPKPTKLNPPQNEDFLLGIAGGASTLTALQPLLDEEDTLSEQKQKLELQLAQIQQLPLNPTAQQSVDPLSRFTLAKYESFNEDSVLQVCDAHVELVDDIIDDPDDDEEASNQDGLFMLDDAARELEEEEEEEEEEGDDEEEDDDFEWVEINAEEDDENGDYGDENDEDEEERYVYWEGDLPPMTKEEEAKVLRRAKKELARLEKEKRASTKGAASYTNLIGELEDDEEEDEEDALEDYSSDGSETEEEAYAALTQFEASARKTTVAKNYQKVVFMKDEISYGAAKKKLPLGHMQSEIKMEVGLDDEEDETALAAACIAKEAKAEDRRKSQPQTDEGERKQPKRSIPAVMRSFDKAKIFVKAGNGGNGVVAFRREKYVPFGGPSGGSGGRGGNIYVRADPSMNSLLSFRRSVHFRAGRGSHGMGKSQDGATGEDCTIDVPLGTVIREADGISGPGKVLLEVTRPNQCKLLLLGGRGGRGNTAFKTGRNKTPQLAENGEEGVEMWLELELKLVADVGIIGVPNAGKSTLLSVISAAQPAIAAYPFTTLLPNLGVVPIGFDSTMVVADLPGLLEGAHLGIGLGHEFLRHTERCRVLVHIVDGTSQQPEHEYEAVRLELQLFNPALSEKPSIVAFNKMDIPEAADRWPNFQAYLKQKGIEPICMSAATKKGVIDVVNKAYSLLQSLPSSPYENDSDEESQGADEPTIGEIIRRQHSAPIEEFEIIHNKDSKIWQIQGVGLERFVQMTNWEYFEALTRFQHVLTVSGINKALKEQGVAEGDTVIIGEMEFAWNDSEDIRAADWKRGFRGSRLWPH